MKDKYESIFEAKELHRRKLMNINFNEKLQVLSTLQERAVFFGKTNVRFTFNENFRFKNIIDILDELKNANLITDYALGGSVALLYYTKPEFITDDVDIFISFESESLIFDLSNIYDYLKTHYNAKEEKEWIVIQGIPIQFLAPDSGLHGEAFKAAQTIKVDDKTFKIFTLEYLIAIMVFLNRPKYKARLLLIMQENEFDTSKLFPILKEYDLLNKWNRLHEILKD